MNTFDKLTSNFSRLPGIGKKSAVRIVNWLLKQDTQYLTVFSQNLKSLKEKIKPCSICGTWTETDPCPICTDPLRDKSQICVVEQPQDVNTIEEYGEYKGMYHVLGGLIKPLDGIGPAQLSIQPLISKIRTGKVKEVIIATNPTVEGDTTALYLNKIISEIELQSPEAEYNNETAEKTDTVKVTRLATGIPVGGDLEYIDKRTLSLSFRGRTSF